MGTGKTLAALWAADFLMKQFPKGTVQVLILAPLSTLTTVWANEIKRHFFGRRSFAVVHGSAERRVKLLRRDYDFYIMNHDGPKVTAVQMMLAVKDTIKIVIIDEASAYRNAASKRSKTVRRLLTGKPYVWALTGTPTPQGPEDAHGIKKIVDPDYTDSKAAWRDKVTMAVSMFKRLPVPGGYEQARRLLQPAIRFPRSAEIAALAMPPQRLSAPFSAQQHRLYTELKKEFKAMVLEGGGQIDAVHEGALRLKLVQIACGAVYDSDRTAYRLDVDPRIRVLMDLIEQSPGKVLVFAPFTSVLSLLYDRLTAWSREVVHGGVPLGRRTKIFQAFRTTADPHLIIADAGTMSHGLTLTEANTTIWYGPTDRTETYIQANDRINRPGQTRNTFTMQISGCKEEDTIYDRLQNNESLQGAMLSMME